MRILPSMSRWSLRRKLVSVIMLASLVCLLVSLSVLWVSATITRYEDSLQQLSGLADVLAENGQAALMFSDQTEANRLLDSVRDSQDVASAWLVTTDGTALASWHRKGKAEALPSDYRVLSRQLSSNFWERRADIYYPVARNAELVGYVLLKADFTVQRNNQLAVLGKSLVGAALALVVVFILATRLQRVISRPLAELAGTARAIAHGKNYSLRVPLRTKDEIGDLVQAFNGMLGEIQERDENLTRHRDHLEEEVSNRTVELRRAKEEAEAASRFKGQFLANMSHELRTPLTSIRGTLGLLSGGVAGALPDAASDLLRIANNNCERLSRLVNDILDLSKIEAGKLSLESIDFDLPALVRDAAGVFRAQANAKNISFTCELDAELPQFCKGDPTRLGQVLINLMGNALKFTERGEVRVKVRSVMRGDTRATISFAISDSGIGIDPKDLGKLFQTFEQADPSTTRRFGGTGLGLAICKQLVDLMGGQIEVDSQVGVGSTFRVLLPLPYGEPLRQA